MRVYAKCVIITLLISIKCLAVSNSVATAAAITTMATNFNAIVHTIHHPKLASKSAGKAIKKVVVFHKSGKLTTLPLPKDPPPAQ